MAEVTAPFWLDSIEPVEPPEGSEGSWFRYVITQKGVNKITGIRSGTRAEVGSRLDDMIQCLNDRRLGKYGSKTKGTAASKRG